MTSATGRTVRVNRIQVEALDILSFELADLQDKPLPPFSAGSHIDVHVPGGVVRQYSLCNDPRETNRYVVAVLKDPMSRGGSTGMHALEVGQELRISDPKNHFPLAHEASHSVLFAGGIGITPILCMAERLSAIGASFELHYCTRASERAAFSECLRQSAYAQHVQFYYDEGPLARRMDPRDVLRSQAATQATHLYVCGPTGFMDWVLGTARECAWPEARLHREYFAAGPVDTSNDGSFDIQIASTGTVIRVAPEQTVVAALANAGIEVQTSCEQGVCGTCLTRVLEGTPEHRDMFLTPEEQAANDQFLPCCSRAKSARLVLDL